MNFPSPPSDVLQLQEKMERIINLSVRFAFITLTKTFFSTDKHDRLVLTVVL